ncbi:MAG: ywlE [Bacilli bacterium]|nr:ywlE [Bacilli bacterium]
MNILFVCTGNTCRSPMAELLLKKRLLQESDLSHVQVQSAGIAAIAGAPASKGAARALKNRTENADAHQSQPFTLQLSNWAHLILTMTTSHKEYLMDSFPSLCDKTFTLKEYIGDSVVDIADPYGGSDELFDACAAEIETALEELVKKLKDNESV